MLSLSTVVMVTVAHRPAPLTLHVIWQDGTEPRQTVLFSHGDGVAPAEYAPLLHGWAGRGLFIAAPDHAGPALCPLWLARVLDIQEAAAQLPALAARHAGLTSRSGAAPIRLAGHSYGGHTVAVLLGARPTLVDNPGNLILTQADAGLLLAPPGDGGAASLTSEWAERAPYLCLDLAGFRAPAMIVAGERDASPITRRDWRWHTDLFTQSPPSCKYLGIASAGDHYLGGIATGRGTPDPALLGDIVASTAGYLLHGPAWTPPPTEHLGFTAHPGKHAPKGNPA